MQKNMPYLKKIYNYVDSIFSGDAKVFGHRDESGRFSIEILTTIDVPWEGVQSVATLGLSEYKNGNFNFGVEIIGACASAFLEYPSVIATAAFNVLKSGFVLFPGAVFLDVIKMYDEDSPLCHLLFIPPFLWDDKFNTITIDNKQVAWLQAIPIFDSEKDHLNAHGLDALEDLFEKHDIDVFNIYRDPVV